MVQHPKDLFSIHLFLTIRTKLCGEDSFEQERHLLFLIKSRLLLCLSESLFAIFTTMSFTFLMWKLIFNVIYSMRYSTFILAITDFCYPLRLKLLGGSCPSLQECFWALLWNLLWAVRDYRRPCKPALEKHLSMRTVPCVFLKPRKLRIVEAGPLYRTHR